MGARVHDLRLNGAYLADGPLWEALLRYGWDFKESDLSLISASSAWVGITRTVESGVSGNLPTWRMESRRGWCAVGRSTQSRNSSDPLSPSSSIPREFEASAPSTRWHLLVFGPEGEAKEGRHSGIYPISCRPQGPWTKMREE